MRGEPPPERTREPRITVVLVTRNRPDDLRRCLESVAKQTVRSQVIVLDNAPEVGAEASVSADTLLLHGTEFLGPADAKNLAFEHALAPVVVLLDDDAELAASDALARVLAVFDADPRVGCLALNCLAIQPGGAAIEQMARLRAVRRDARHMSVAGEAAYPAAEFIGAGSAFRLSVFRSVGGFPTGYGYGYEEPHLAYRILDAGWRILYLQSVTVRHYHSRSWRLSAQSRLSSQLRNKWAMAAELFPALWIPLALGPFTIRMLGEMRRNGVPWAGPLRWACRSFLAEWRHRRPLSLATVRTAARLRGRL